ncbi:MAG: OmpA family protein [Candidatus Latescibacteria bacterium]|nr:OmpA family protein [Candidatus Latescibacterota bacterium]
MLQSKWTRCALMVLVGITGIMVGAPAAFGQFDPDAKAGFTAGIDGGVIFPITDTAAKDEMDIHFSGYLRHGIMPKLQGSLTGGYGLLGGEDYGTDMAHISFRLLYSILANEQTNLYLSGGVGALRYDLDELPPSGRLPGSIEGISWVGMIPLGLGVQYKLNNRLALEAGFDYYLTMSDDLNAVNIDSGDDAFWGIRAGVTVGLFGKDEPMPAPAPAPVVDMDQDGDGLTDREETTIYYTNPLKADSDNDGLNDGDEVKKYLTNPNKADTDGGSVGDGEELGRGTDPLQASDDVVVEERAIEMIQEPLQPVTVLFASESSKLTPASKTALGGLVKVLQEWPEQKLVLTGHTDNTGTTSFNSKLSRNRAQAVKNYLVQQGVEASRLSISAKGASDPADSNDTKAGRQQNRRVDIGPSM